MTKYLNKRLKRKKYNKENFLLHRKSKLKMSQKVKYKIATHHNLIVQATPTQNWEYLQKD